MGHGGGHGHGGDADHHGTAGVGGMGHGHGGGMMTDAIFVSGHGDGHGGHGPGGHLDHSAGKGAYHPGHGYGEDGAHHHGPYGDGHVGGAQPGQSLKPVCNAPKGRLAVGLQKGQGYVDTPAREAFAQGFGNLVTDRLSNRGRISFDTMALRIARECMPGPASERKVLWHPEVSLADLECFKGYRNKPEFVSAGRRVNLQGIGRDATSVEALNYFHGKCDVYAAIANLARSAGVGFCGLRGCSVIDPSTTNLLTPLKPKTYPGIRPHSPFVEQKGFDNMPNGWFKGVGGDTTIWRRFWQVPRELLFSSTNTRTFLVEMGASMHYRWNDGQVFEDWETRVSFSLYSLSYTRNNYSEYDWYHFKLHRELAETLAQGLMGYLRGYRSVNTIASRAHHAVPPPPAPPTRSAEERRNLDEAMRRTPPSPSGMPAEDAPEER